MMRHDWPGNVRELENVVERAIVLGKTEAILIEDLPMRMQEQKVVFEPELEILPENIPFEQRVENFEKRLIVDALEKTNWIQTKAAEFLGTSRSILKYKMKKYGIKKGVLETPLTVRLFCHLMCKTKTLKTFPQKGQERSKQNE